MLGINTKIIKKYKKIKDISKLRKKIINDYSKKSFIEKQETKLELNNIIADSDRLAGFTLFLTLFNSIMKEILSGIIESCIKDIYYPNTEITQAIQADIDRSTKLPLALLMVLIFIFIAIIIIYIMNNYRISKLYLNVIGDIEDNKYIYDVQENKYRHDLLKNLYNRYNSDKPNIRYSELQKEYEQKLQNELTHLQNENYISIRNDEILISQKAINIIDNLKDSKH